MKVATFLIGVFQATLMLLTPMAVVASGIKDLTDPIKIAIYSTITFAEVLFTLFLAWYFACRKYENSFVDGFMLYRVSTKAVVTALAAAVLLIAFDLLTAERLVGQPTHAVWRMYPPVGAICFSLLLLAQPIAIVLFYQGFIYGTLINYGRTSAYIATVAAYTFLTWLGRGPVTAMISPAILAAVLTYQTGKFGSVVPAMMTMYLRRFIMVIIIAYCLATGIPV